MYGTKAENWFKKLESKFSGKKINKTKVQKNF